MNVPANVKDLFKGGTVQTGSEMAARLRRGKHQDQVGQNEGPYINTSKTNMMQFVYGQDNAPVPDGTLFAFNIMGAETGFAYWFKKSIKIMAKSIWDEAPYVLDELPAEDEYTREEIAKMGKHFYGQPEWMPYYHWQLQAVHGPNLDIKGVYHGTQYYMRSLSERLIDEAANRIEDSELIVPVCRLYNEPYDHPKGHGLTNSHKVEILAWAHPSNADQIEWIGEAPALAAPKAKPRQKRARRAS